MNEELSRIELTVLAHLERMESLGSGDFDASQIAQEYNLPTKEVSKAMLRLEKLGLVELELEAVTIRSLGEG